MLVVTSGGYGKRTAMTEFPRQGRGGFGVKAIKLTRVRGTLVSARAVAPGDEVFVISSQGIVIRQEADTISRQKRDSTGVKVMDIPKGAEISAFDLVPLENGDD